MNILIVDDDKYVIGGIQNGVDWDSLPFENRFEARNGVEARKILTDIPIHVLLCDIEMPQESGLELLAWIRQQGSELPAIFLTSYADFNYAQRAIQLGSFEYFLKPIEYDKLTGILAEAAAKVKEEELNQQYRTYAQYWMDSEETRKEAFWTKVIGRRRAMQPEQLEALLREERLDYRAEAHFVIMALHLEPKMKQDWRDEEMVWYQLTTTFSACLSDCLTEREMVQVEAAWKESRSLWFLVLSVKGPEERLWAELGRAASNTRKELKRDYLEFAVYLSEETSIGDAWEQTARIRQMLFNNLAYGNGIFFVNEFQPGQGQEFAQELALDTGQVEEWMLQENKEALMGYVESQIQAAGEKRDLNAGAIQRLLLDWMQAVFLYLRKNQVEADRLFATEEYKSLYEKAGESLRGCREYLHYLVEKAMDYGKYARESEDIIGQLERYIEAHLPESLTRASLAEVVYLNSDYLAQMFKKAKGVSLMKYINCRRLERAKELLLTTGDPVYTIARKVGYPTSSYFAKQFRESFGIGPNDYRRQRECL